MTADATPGLEEQLHRLGADGVVIKPVDVDDVLGWIDRAAAGDR